MLKLWGLIHDKNITWELKLKIVIGYLHNIILILFFSKFLSCNIVYIVIIK